MEGLIEVLIEGLNETSLIRLSRLLLSLGLLAD